jgi:hypothetical protein
LLPSFLGRAGGGGLRGKGLSGGGLPRNVRGQREGRIVVAMRRIRFHGATPSKCIKSRACRDRQA